MKRCHIFLIVLMIPGLCNVGYSETQKEVRATVEEFPNYIFHILTLGEIVPEDAEYLMLYKDSISVGDQTYLHDQRDLLAWGDGKIGPLTQFFVFLPGYLNFQSQVEIDGYFDLLDHTLKDGDFDNFTQKYESDLNKIKLLYRQLDMKAALQSIVQYADAVSRIGAIYKRNYPMYHRQVWPNEKAKLETVAQAINVELRKQELINHWERVTGVRFKTGGYQIVLFSANQNGPSANSLGYDRNTFYYGRDINQMVQFISHEVGTHLLIDDVYQVMQTNRYQYMDVYRVYENLAEFYNAKFICQAKPIIGYDVEKYYQIFDRLYNLNQNNNHQDLLVKGLEAL